MANASTRHSFRCAATSGISIRISAAASANGPRMEPITEALMPRSKPSTGTTKVCTSQHDDKNQLTIIRRRNTGSRSRSQALGRTPGAATMGGNSCVRRTRNQLASGSAAIRKNAAR